MKYIVIITFAAILSSCCKKEKEPEILKNPELYGTWRLDSIMHITAQTATVIDTFYFGDLEAKRIITTFNEDNSLTFDYVSKPVEGKGVFELKEFEQIDMEVYRTSTEWQGYRWVSSYLDAMNNATSYSINGNQLTIFYQNYMAKFTKE